MKALTILIKDGQVKPQLSDNSVQLPEEKKEPIENFICKDCGKPFNNPVFTVCDECWDKKYKPPENSAQELKYVREQLTTSEKMRQDDYNDYQKELESSEIKNKILEGALEHQRERNMIYQAEIKAMKEENERLKNDLLDALGLMRLMK